jgi:hypothetical protein
MLYYETYELNSTDLTHMMYVCNTNLCIYVCMYGCRWALNLRPVLATAGSSSVGGRVTVDASKAVWQKVCMFITHYT